jgi:hypothetical protein
MDPFLESISKAVKPKQLVTALRYAQAPARVGGGNTRNGAVAQRMALRAKAGTPAPSANAAFDGINAAMKAPKPAPSYNSDALARGMAGAAPKGPRVTKPSEGAVASGNQAANDAARAVKGRADRNRKLKLVGYTGAGVVGSGGAVVGADALNDKRKAKRARLAG